MLWIFNIYFFSLKWKSSEPRFFTLHWSFWWYEFLSTGKAVHSCFSLSLYVCIFLNMRCKISFDWKESLLPYSVNPLWIHELYIPNTEKNWKQAHNNLGNCLSNKKNQLYHYISPKKMWRVFLCWCHVSCRGRSQRGLGSWEEGGTQIQSRAQNSAQRLMGHLPKIFESQDYGSPSEQGQ